MPPLRKNKKIGIILTSSFSLLVSPTAQALQEPPFNLHAQNIVQEIDQFIEAEVRQKKIPGCAIAIIQDHQIKLLKGYGYKRVDKKQDLINADTVFQLGSVSKPIAATLALILEQQGLLSLQDPIYKHLDFKPLVHHSPLRLHHVLTHTTGISRSGLNRLIEGFAPWPSIQRVLEQRTCKNRLRSSQYEYNNASYGLIGWASAAAAGSSFQTLLQNHLFKPLHMLHSSSTLQALLNQPNRAYPHLKSKKGQLMACSDYSKGYYTVPAAGGINSSARDLALFVWAQLGHSPHVLSPRSLMHMHRSTIATPEVLRWFRHYKGIKSAHYGLGWRIVNLHHEKLVFHTGWVKGFTNFVGFIPQKGLGIVVLHNSESKFAFHLGMKFFQNTLSPHLYKK